MSSVSVFRQHPLVRNKDMPLIVRWVRKVSVISATINPVAIAISEAEVSSVIAQCIIINFCLTNVLK